MSFDSTNKASASALASAGRSFERLAKCREAAIAPLTALMMLPIAGGISFAVELGSWNYMQRSLQNAADSAAIAAASVNSGAATTGSTSLNEARAAAKKFGFTDGVNNTAVTSATIACPTGVAAGSTCYHATVTTVFPVTFANILGFTGSQALGTGRGQKIVGSAIATAAGGGGALTQNVCVWTFTNLQTNGTPDANLAGCSVLSGGNMTCTGQGLHADYSVAGGTVSGLCAQNTENNLSAQSPLPTDPYAALATSSNIPPVCGSTVPQNMIKGSGKTGKWQIPAARKATNEIALGTPTWAGSQKTFCGDVQLTGNVTLTGTSTIIIENGRLDLNGFTIATQAGAAATLVFSGNPTSTAYSHYPSTLNGGGMIDIAAPGSTSSSAWKGIAIYQDPRMTTTTVDFTYAGNDPAWKISGVVYLPNATTTFSGVVNKASNGAACLILVADQVTINGTGKIIGDVSNCSAAGITPPTVTVGNAIREKLVL